MQNKRAQGGLEYIMLIGGMVLVTAIIIASLTNLAGKIGDEKQKNAICGNAKCEEGETNITCPIDCTGTCNNDGICDTKETFLKCSHDCGKCAGNDNCSDGQSCTTDVCLLPRTPTANCIHTPITACSNDDGCCPAGCSSTQGAANYDNDCATGATHKDCVGMSCAVVSGAGADVCTQDSYCQHKTCIGLNCTVVAGHGTDSCTTSADCATPPQTCTSFTYSDWGECQPENLQYRTILTALPTGCTGGNPILTQACTYVPPQCNNNGNCENGETQSGCPADCLTVSNTGINLFAHSYANPAKLSDYELSTTANNYQMVENDYEVNTVQNTPDVFTKLKTANPTVNLLLYDHGGFRSSERNTDWTTTQTNIANWIMHPPVCVGGLTGGVGCYNSNFTQNCTQISIENCKEFQTNLASVGTGSIAENLGTLYSQTISANGLTGVKIDNLDYAVGYFRNQYSNYSSFSSPLTSFLSAIKTKIGNKLLLYNGLRDYLNDNYNTAPLTAADGALLEEFCTNNLNNGSQLTKNQMLGYVNAIKNNPQKIFYIYENGGTSNSQNLANRIQTNKFCLALYLIAKQNKTFYGFLPLAGSAPLNNNSRTGRTISAAADDFLNVGQPTEQYQTLAGGTLKREFNNAIAYVNLESTAQTVNLPTTMFDLEGNSKNTISLQPKTAEIMLKNLSTICNNNGVCDKFEDNKNCYADCKDITIDDFQDNDLKEYREYTDNLTAIPISNPAGITNFSISTEGTNKFLHSSCSSVCDTVGKPTEPCNSQKFWGCYHNNVTNLIKNADNFVYKRNVNTIANFRMKAEAIGASTGYPVFVGFRVETNETTPRFFWLIYSEGTYSDYSSSNKIFSISPATTNWQTFSRNLEADLQTAGVTASIADVGDIIIGGSGSVDDIVLSAETNTPVANVKNMSVYSNKEAFLISDSDWKNVLPLIPATTWTGTETNCQRGTGTPSNVCAYPTLIFHDEGAAFDADSIIWYLQQYSPSRLTVINNTTTELDNLLVAAAPVGAGLQASQLQRKSSLMTGYFYYWQTFNDIVYSKDDYATALLAASYSSLINAPLVIQGANYDIASIYSGKNVICVGGVAPTGVTCNENYSIDQLQAKYLQLTNTDKIILVNPNDWTIKGEGYFSPERSSGTINNIFTKISLVAPILAAAKQELIFETTNTTIQTVDSDLQNKINSLSMQPNYLTIIASPDTIKNTHAIIGDTKNSGTPWQADADSFYYADYKDSFQMDMAIGRIYSSSSSDMSSYIARDLLMEKITNSTKFTTLTNNTGPGELADGGWTLGAEALDTTLESTGLNKQSKVVNWPNDSTITNSDMKDRKAMIYIDHGLAIGWAYSVDTTSVGEHGIANTWLAPSVILSDACLTCAYGTHTELDGWDVDNKSELFCTNVIRRGALAHIGAVDVGRSGLTEIFGKITAQKTIGDSFKEAINENYANYILYGSYITLSDLSNQFELVGDPTINLGLLANSTAEKTVQLNSTSSGNSQTTEINIPIRNEFINIPKIESNPPSTMVKSSIGENVKSFRLKVVHDTQDIIGWREKIFTFENNTKTIKQATGMRLVLSDGTIISANPLNGWNDSCSNEALNKFQQMGNINWGQNCYSHTFSFAGYGDIKVGFVKVSNTEQYVFVNDTIWMDGFMNGTVPNYKIQIDWELE